MASRMASLMASLIASLMASLMTSLMASLDGLPDGLPECLPRAKMEEKDNWRYGRMRAPFIGGAAYALLERGLRVYGVDPTPPGRKHAPIVAEHPRFVEIVARLGEPGLLQRLPTDVDWLLCDANIAPDVAVPHLADLCSRCGERLQGLFYTYMQVLTTALFPHR